MTSIGEVYDAQARGMVDPGVLRFGLGLFVGGVLLAFASLILATTGIAEFFGLGTFDARLVAGILGGVAVPLVLVGTLSIFPASRRARAAAAIGAGIAALGVALFWHAYPADWAGYGRDLTPIVSTVYAIGVVTMAWALFTTVATFKKRNDPGGTVNFHLAPTTGQPRFLEVARAGIRQAAAGAGDWISGTTPSPTPSPQPMAEPAAPSRTDGGEGEILGAGVDRHPVDRYCGNCTHFTYGNDAEGRLSPYCLYHDEAMDDMEPCPQWEANAS